MVGVTVAEMTVAVGVELVVVVDGAGMVSVMAEVFLLQRDR